MLEFSLNDVESYDLDTPQEVIGHPDRGCYIETDCRESLVYDVGIANMAVIECLWQTPIIKVGYYDIYPTEELVTELSKWLRGFHPEGAQPVCEIQGNFLVFNTREFISAPSLSTIAFILKFFSNSFKFSNIGAYAREIIEDWEELGFEYLSDAVLTALYLKEAKEFGTGFFAGVGCNGPASYVLRSVFTRRYILRRFFDDYAASIEYGQDCHLDIFDEEDDLLNSLIHLVSR
jgi:hypothetical protein